ncbi:hypothetical protein NBDNFGHP_00019 [Salmonella phage MET_P1_100_107]|uniref:Peptidase S74 domain-containing protein n=1 Tax=Salmonella phage MET_P1_100_107 TaxID=3032419 RepID=A0AAF0JID6_9CAUD|nr:hypothetical protein NBDNFGHP_00019 [Salmonella phage MET_P1_100_107]
MAITKIILQQMATMDQNSITASKYPKYTVVLGNTISSITAGELTSAIESSKASAAAAKQSEINAKQSELNAKDSENEAEISSTSSQQSATQSASSATASANSAKAAKTSETNAKASETAAKTSETNAKASETAAKISETNAKASETAAAASASAAKISETNAKQSELNAKNSENEAEISAASSQQSAAQSASSATAAANSAEAANTSETNAKASELAAKTSETNAKASELAAKTSETNAKASETTAAAAASAAKISETNAAASASAAKTSEINAANSASAASDSKGFRDEAEIFATQAAADAASAKNSETAAKTSETNAKASETATKQAQAEAAESANTASAAIVTINQIKVDTQKLKDDAVAETTELKNTAVTAASTATDKATQAEQSAATSTSKADIATQKASDAEAAAARAEQAASGTLKKDQNLADVANINTARTNLKVDKVVQGASYSDFLSANGAMRLRVQDNNTWGGWNGQWIALSVGNGGTGATSAEGARDNLETFRESRTALGETDLNTLTGAKSGVYYQAGNADATPGRGYPESASGTLMVLRNVANGIDGCTQIYYPYNNRNRFHIRNCLAGNPSSWTEWSTYNRPDNSPEFRASIGLGGTDKVQFGQVKAYGTSGFFADGIESTQGASFVTRYYDSTNTHKGQGEFRVDTNGDVSIINRATKSGDTTHFFTFDRAGRFWSPNGITTATSMNWNDGNNVVNRGLFMSGQVNAPTADTVHAGIHVGYSNSYAMQIAARDNSFHGRCLENNSWKEWKKFALENNDIVNFLAAGYTSDAIYTTRAISFINGGTTYGLPVAYGVLAGFGNGATSAAGCYVGQLCWNKTTGELFTRVRDDGKKAWLDWLKVTTAAISDESLKDVKGNLNVEGALDNINRMEFKLFRYLKDSPERSTRRGVIAQQVRNIDREYTTKVGDKLHLDTTPMLLDGLAAIQALTKRDQENKGRISTLEKEVEELKVLVNKLINTDNLA